MSETRYQYHRFTRHEPAYRVKFREHTIGEVARYEPLDERRTGRKVWWATLVRDPFVVGRGHTRDAAVEDALGQVGGLG